MINKQNDVQEYKRRVLTRRIVFFSLLVAGIAFFVVVAIVNGSNLVELILITAGTTLLVASIVVSILMNENIRKLNERIEKYCPKCNNASFTLVNLTKEDAGHKRAENYSKGMAYGKIKFVRETKYYKCSCCGYETQVKSTSAE
ncbi:MAG: hypothetical protein FWE16_05885 [Firmicutes bacterium]|nr:hypothetical protein [Bacillota bacterium]